jgi:hypothetical protein
MPSRVCPKEPQPNHSKETQSCPLATLGPGEHDGQQHAAARSTTDAACTLRNGTGGVGKGGGGHGAHTLAGDGESKYTLPEGLTERLSSRKALQMPTPTPTLAPPPRSTPARTDTHASPPPHSLTCPDAHTRSPSHEGAQSTPTEARARVPRLLIPSPNVQPCCAAEDEERDKDTDADGDGDGDGERKGGGGGDKGGGGGGHRNQNLLPTADTGVTKLERDRQTEGEFIRKHNPSGPVHDTPCSNLHKAMLRESPAAAAAAVSSASTLAR